MFDLIVTVGIKKVGDTRDGKAPQKLVLVRASKKIKMASLEISPSEFILRSQKSFAKLIARNSIPWTEMEQPVPLTTVESVSDTHGFAHLNNSKCSIYMLWNNQRGYCTALSDTCSN